MYLIVNTSGVIRRIPVKGGFEELKPRESIQVDKSMLSPDVVRMLEQGRFPGVKVYDLSVAKVVRPTKTSGEKKSASNKSADVTVTDTVKIEKTVEGSVESEVTQAEAQPESAANKVVEATPSDEIDLSIPEEQPKKSGRRGRKSKK